MSSDGQRSRWLFMTQAGWTLVIVAASGCVRPVPAGGPEASRESAGPSSAREDTRPPKDAGHPSPDSEDPLVQDLRDQVARDGYAVALARYEKRRRSDPKDALTYAALGVLYAESRQAQKALAALRRSVALGARRGFVFRYLGSLYLAQHDLAKAVAAFRRAVEAGPHDARAHLNLGLALFYQEELGSAIPALKRSIELDPRSVEGTLALANAQFLRGEIEASAAALRTCLNLDPGNESARFEWGRVQLALGNLKEAERAFQEVIARSPRRGEYHQNLAIVYLQGRSSSENEAAALESLKRALELEPGSPDSHFLLGDLYRRQGRLEDAALELRQAVRLKPQAVNMRYALAQVLRQLGREAEAARHLARVKSATWSRRRLFLQREIDFNPGNAEARFELGCLHEREERYPQSVHQFQVLAGLEPGGRRAHQHLAAIYSRLGDPRRAAKERALAAGLD